MLGRRGVYPRGGSALRSLSTGKPLPSELPTNMRIFVWQQQWLQGGARYSAELLEAATKRR